MHLLLGACTLALSAASAKDGALQTSVPATASAVHGPTSQEKLKEAMETHNKHVGVALAAVKGSHASEAASSTQEAQKNMAARFQEVHQKAIAKTRLGVKAETYATSRDKNVADTTAWMPFVLPPVGLCLLGGIVFGVISIRKWQKIPSMPTQGRMDIKDVQASARQAGGSHREMKRPT